MLRIRFSARAEKDLAAIFAYTLRQWSIEQAFHYLTSMRENCKHLAYSPFLGVPCDDIHIGLRRLTHRQHAIFYVVNQQRVLIGRVLHRQQLPARRLFQHLR